MKSTGACLKPTTKVGLFIRLEWKEGSAKPMESIVRVYFNDSFLNLELTGGNLYRLQEAKENLKCCEVCRGLVMHAYTQSHHPEIIFNKQKLFSLLTPSHFVSMGHKECLKALRINNEQVSHFQYVDEVGAEVSIYTSNKEVI